MARNRILQIYRGTTAQNDAFTGAAGELTMDTTTNEIRIHDGSTAGGHKIGAGYHPDLFDVKWADHILNDVQWLRADTFSWQAGSVYQAAYQHLTADITGKTLQSETIGGTTVQFYLADDGHKICPASEESNVAAIFTATGVAWYYILDEANQRFKLPRSKHEHYGNRPVIGNGKSVCYTNGSETDIAILSRQGTSSPASNAQTCAYTGNLGNISETGWYNGELGLSTDPTKSGIISTPVQDTDQYKYLYFYVGSFTQTALENTAGLNAELFNGKAGVNMDNISATGRATAVGWVMPDYANGTVLTISNTYQPITDDGYLYFYGSGGGGWVDVGVSISLDGSTELLKIVTSSAYHVSEIIPVTKGIYVKPVGVTSSMRFYPSKK